jgi:hypothetical protein
LAAELGADRARDQRRAASRSWPRPHALQIAVARATNKDDVLFWLPDGPAGFAEVHLTWTGKRESRPEWPRTRLFSSFEDWVERGLIAEEVNERPPEQRVVRPDDVLLEKDLDAGAFRLLPESGSLSAQVLRLRLSARVLQRV